MDRDERFLKLLTSLEQQFLMTIQQKLEAKEISSESYQRQFLILLDRCMDKLDFESSFRDELVATELRIYGEIMYSAKPRVRDVLQHRSSLHNLPSQQLADRFLNGVKAKNTKPMLEPLSDVFEQSLRSFLKTLGASPNQQTAQRTIKNESQYFGNLEIERSVTYKRPQKMQSEESLFQTAKERLVQLEISNGQKPSYSVNKSSHTVKQTKAAVEQEEVLAPEVAEIMCDDRAKGLDPVLIQRILFDVVENISSLTWDDVAGLKFVKECIREIVIFPMLRPDLFQGLRAPVKGLLLFGPPGTGKTMIGKCIASESKSTFFSISASSLTSKYIGESEKMVRTLFTIARIKQPSVIFIDEIDSLMTQRSDSEHEASRRLKTEFLVQFDGLTTKKNERLLVIGATNRPQELDEAARRRFVKKLYIPLPMKSARKEIVKHLMKQEKNNLSEEDIEKICLLTDRYSGADVTSLCQEAALGPIRKIGSKLLQVDINELPPILMDDFIQALHQIKASVSNKDMETYEHFNENYGAVASSKMIEETPMDTSC